MCREAINDKIRARQAGRHRSLYLNYLFSPSVPKRFHFSAWLHPAPVLDYLAADLTDASLSYCKEGGQHVPANLGAMQGDACHAGSDGERSIAAGSALCCTDTHHLPHPPLQRWHVTEEEVPGGDTPAGRAWKIFGKIYLSLFPHPPVVLHHSPQSSHMRTWCQWVDCSLADLLAQKIIWFVIIISCWAGFTVQLLFLWMALMPGSNGVDHWLWLFTLLIPGIWLRLTWIIGMCQQCMTFHGNIFKNYLNSTNWYFFAIYQMWFVQQEGDWASPCNNVTGI